MKHTVQRGLSVEALCASVPSRYRPQLPTGLREPKYTLLLFRNDRDDVILSRSVKSALADVANESGPLVAVGGCFTAEGLELLQARQAIILQLAEFFWTDESYLAIRTRR